MPKYPKREPYFAQKAIRLLVKTAATQHIGQAAALLVVTVATTEDAARYRRPVSFFNGQLMMLLGIQKWESLDRARKVAIESGWLCYEAPPKGKRKPGLYWVTIPPDVAGLDDSPVDEAYPQPYPQVSPPNGYGEGDSSGYSRGYGEGELSELTLNPNPKDLSPTATPATSNGKPKPADEHFEAFWRIVLKTAKHKAVKKGEAQKRYREAVRKLRAKHADPHAFLAARAAAYYASPEGQTQFANGPAPWLNQGRYDDDPTAWEGNGHATPDPDPTPIIRATTPPPKGYEA